MAEPARKLEDIEPEIRPNLHVIEGGGNATPERANLRALENQESSPEKPSNDSVAEQEANGSNVQGPWKNNFSGNGKGSSKSEGRLSFLKKKGPVAVIVTLLFGGGMGFAILSSPVLLFQHITATLLHRYNAQNASMEIRSTKLLVSKMGMTTGICGPVITIKCKLSTMSEKQVENFRKAGIEVYTGEATITTETTTTRPDGTKSTSTTTETKPSTGNPTTEISPVKNPDGSTTTTKIISEKISTNKNLFGRFKPTGLGIEGNIIKPTELFKTIETSPRVRSMIKLAYNPKFAGLADNIWVKKVLAKFRLSEKAGKLGKENATDAERLKAVQEEVNGTGNSAKPQIKGCGSSAKPCTEEEAKKAGAEKKPNSNEYYTEAEAEKLNATTKKAATEALAATENGKVSAAKKSSFIFKASYAAKSAANIVSITGPSNQLCMAYELMKAIAFAAKTVRADQLAKFAFLYLGKFDQQKAGDGVEGEMSYLGKVLTTETLDENDNPKTATDSFGYKYAAYGDTNDMPTSTNRFMVGGGLAGTLSLITDTLKEKSAGLSDKVCNTLLSWPVFIGSMAIGGLAIVLNALVEEIPIVNIIFTSATLGKVASVIAIMGVIKYLPAMLQDMVAGVLVDETTVGEDAGDALVSGTSVLLGKAAQSGGNAPMVVDQAVEYATLSNDISAQYAEEDRLAYNPLDATNSNTFMGKIAAWLIPYASKISSLSGALSSITSVVTKSFSFIAPQSAKAISTEEYTMCKDTEYNKLNLAADPFCNISYGIPGVENSPDPVTIADALLNQKDPTYQGSDEDEDVDSGAGTIPFIEPSGEPTEIYKGFIKSCIDRDEPLVISDKFTVADPNGRAMVESNEGHGASGCMYNNETVPYDVTTSWTCTEPDEITAPKPGSVFLSSYIQTIPLPPPAKCPQHILHSYYIGNSYLYLFYIDQRVESGMDGV